MPSKKPYAKPKVESRKIQLGARGNCVHENVVSPGAGGEQPVAYPQQA